MFSGPDLRNAPPVFFSPCRKEDGPRREASPLGRPGQKKRAPNAMNSCTARKPGIAIVERGAALVQSLYLLTQPSAKARLRSRRCLVEKRTTLTPLPGESNGGIRRSPLAVSIREGQGRARCVANVPVARLQPKRGASCACDQGQRIRTFATFLWPIKEKLICCFCPRLHRGLRYAKEEQQSCSSFRLYPFIFCDFCPRRRCNGRAPTRA